MNKDGAVQSVLEDFNEGTVARQEDRGALRVLIFEVVVVNELEANECFPSTRDTGDEGEVMSIGGLGLFGDGYEVGYGGGDAGALGTADKGQRIVIEDAARGSDQGGERSVIS